MSAKCHKQINVMDRVGFFAASTDERALPTQLCEHAPAIS